MQKYYYESFSIESASPKLILMAFKEKRAYALRISSGIRDSNPRPSAWEANALPTELIPQIT